LKGIEMRENMAMKNEGKCEEKTEECKIETEN
jgi:hypothetical protein